jgi:hypothetical protein
MSFLPQDDLDYLVGKGLAFTEKEETPPEGGGKRRGVIFPGYCFEGSLFEHRNGTLLRVASCDLMILIPSQYATTKLDSFYTAPHLKRADGSDPQNANGAQALFGSSWQFWSRHLSENEWRVGIDGLDTYLQYVRAELRKA